MNKLFLAILFCGIACLTKIKAQNAAIDKVVTFDFKNIKAIEEKGVIKGYYFFYTLDKIDKNENLYGLSIYDNNLKQTHYKEIAKSNKIKLLNAKFNGEGFCFEFFDPDAANYEFVIYNTELIEKGKFFISLTKSDAEAIAEYANSGITLFSPHTHTLVAVPYNGFAVYGIFPGKAAYEFRCYDNMGNDMWELPPTELPAKTYHAMTPVFLDENSVVFESILYTNRRKPYDGERSYVFYDSKTGKEISKAKTAPYKYLVSIEEMIIGENENILIGDYYDKDTKKTGVALITLTKNGGVANESYLCLKDEANNFAKDEKQKEILKDRSIVARKVIKTAQNKTYIISDLYDKNNVYDMAIFELDKNAISNMYFFSKKKTKLASNFFTNTNGVGAMLKRGWIDDDYCYTSLSADKSGFTNVYCNYDKENSKDDFMINTVTLTKENKMVEDNIKMSSKPSNFTVLPAKPGYVAVFEYFKKEKRINIKLEKLNL